MMIPLGLLSFVNPPDVPSIVRAADLLTDLGREAQVAVEVPKRFAENRILLVRKGVPPMVAMRAVVRAMDASLVRTARGFEVARPPTQAKALEERRLAMRLGWFRSRRKAIDDYRRASRPGDKGEDPLVAAYKQDALAFKGLASGDRKTFPTTSGFQLLPAAYLVERIIDRIGSSALARIPNDEVRVYETDPVVSALSLPPCRDLLDLYVAATEALGAKGIPETVKDIRGLAVTRPLPDRPSDATRLRLECRSSSNAVSLRLEVYDRSGKRIDSANFGALADGNFVPFEVLTEEAAKRNEADWVPLSPSANEALLESRRSSGTPPLWFADPEREEPLNLFAREGVLALVAGEDARCIAFDVGDEFWGLVKGCIVDGKISRRALTQSLAMFDPYERSADADSVAWRPYDAEAARANRADRRVLARFARAYAAHGIGGLTGMRDQARLYHDASGAVCTLAGVWNGTAQRLAKNLLDDLSACDYTFLGSISDADWGELAQGKTLTVGRMGVTTEFRHLLELGTSLKRGGTPVSDLESHPMELYRSDVGDTTISLGPRAYPVMKLSQDGQASGWGPLTVFDNTFDLSSDFDIEDGHIVFRFSREGYEKLIRPYTFQTATASCLRLDVGLPRDQRLVGESRRQVAGESKPYVYADLPEDVRTATWENAYRRGLAKAQERFAHPTP